jgi:hypothetical protein
MCCPTPVTSIQVTGSGSRALRPRRSRQLRRRWERAARGGRGGRAGGDKLAGKAASVTVCWRQCAIQLRRNWRPATSLHKIASSAIRGSGASSTEVIR